MTQREFFETIKEGTVVTSEMEAYAADALAKIDRANEARKSKTSKKALENEPILAQIGSEVLTEDFKTASEIAAVVGISVQKASALLRSLVAEGRAIVKDIKVPSKGTQKGYALPTPISE